MTWVLRAAIVVVAVLLPMTGGAEPGRSAGVVASSVPVMRRAADDLPQIRARGTLRILVVG
jgi:hypothetical protein